MRRERRSTIRESSNGKTSDFESDKEGSSPSSRANVYKGRSPVRFCRRASCALQHGGVRLVIGHVVVAHIARV